MGGCTVFHGGCAVFWGRCTVFQGGCAVFCWGTALTYKLCILLLLDYFHPRNDDFVSCLPFTEHVQTLFTLNWACANSVLGMCRNNLHNLPCFWQFWLITMTETEHEHRLRLVNLTTSYFYPHKRTGKGSIFSHLSVYLSRHFIFFKKIEINELQLFHYNSMSICLISLHIRSMWETICDAWACWSGWKFGPKFYSLPLFCNTEYPPPPENENCQKSWYFDFSVVEYPPPPKIEI